MATISIIIPTYNSGATLEIALNSIANQSFNGIEVFIVDGLSTDNTLSIAKSFKNKIAHLQIISERDTGIYNAMNKGMYAAKGEWLYFMGADDSFYKNDVLQHLTQLLESTQAKVIYGNARIIGDTGWAKNGDSYDGVFDIHKLLNQNICHQAIFYNTNFVKNKIGNFNLEYKKSSDWDFNLRCWSKHPFEYIDLIIANFVAGGFSTNSNDTSITEDFFKNVLHYFNINPFHPYVNNPNFIYYQKALRKQQKEYPFRYKLEMLQKRIFKKFKNK